MVKYPETRAVKVADLDEIWDPEILKGPECQRVIKLLDSIHHFYKSWLLSMLDEDRMEQDDEDDELLYNAYHQDTDTDISYYFVMHHCHQYSLLLATMLEVKYPESEWRIVYFIDHYVVVKLEDFNKGNVVIYDMMTFLLLKAGIYVNPDCWKSLILQSKSIKTVESIPCRVLIRGFATKNNIRWCWLMIMINNTYTVRVIFLELTKFKYHHNNRT